MNAFAQSGLVALGAAIGGTGRYWIGVLAHANLRPWPWPTLLINVLGSAVLGLFVAAAMERGWSDGWRLFIAVGICGGFTTFSTFSFEAVDLMLRKEYGAAGAYVLASVVICVLGCWAGVHFGRLLFR